MIEEEEAEKSAFSSIILQSMGQKEDVQVALGKLELRRGDRLFICSDGVTAHVKDEDLSAILGSGRGPELVTQEIVDLANERGGTDNITAVVADVSGGDLRRATGPETVTQTFEVVAEFSSPVKKSGASAPATDPEMKTVDTAEIDTPPSGPAAKRGGGEASDELDEAPPTGAILGAIALIGLGALIAYWLLTG